MKHLTILFFVLSLLWANAASDLTGVLYDKTTRKLSPTNLVVTASSVTAGVVTSAVVRATSINAGMLTEGIRANLVNLQYGVETAWDSIQFGSAAGSMAYRLAPNANYFPSLYNSSDMTPLLVPVGQQDDEVILTFGLAKTRFTLNLNGLATNLAITGASSFSGNAVGATNIPHTGVLGVRTNLATSGQTGYLSSEDFNTFNGKLDSGTTNKLVYQGGIATNTTMFGGALTNVNGAGVTNVQASNIVGLVASTGITNGADATLKSLTTTNLTVVSDFSVNGNLSANGLLLSNIMSVTVGGSGQSNLTKTRVWLGDGTNALQEATLSTGLSVNTNTSPWAIITTGSVGDASGSGTNNVFTSAILWGNASRTNSTFTDAQGWHNTNSATAGYVNIQSGNVTATGTYTGNGSGLTNLADTVLTPTYVNGASNLLCSMDVAQEEVYLTNNVTLTNFTGCALGKSKSKVIFFIPVGAVRTITYPSAGANWGIYWMTNCPPTVGQVYTSFTNGSVYALTLQSQGTNLYPMMSEWK
jgi:hypothetical protein